MKGRDQTDLHTVTATVNERVRFIGPGSIIQAVIRLDQTPGSWILTISNPLTCKKLSKGQGVP